MPPTSETMFLREDPRRNPPEGSASPPVRVPARGREIELDFLRGLAILFVLDFHAPVRWLSYPFSLLGFPSFGWAGVDIFFVLSGFLVGGLLIQEWRQRASIDSRRFLIRRGFKIWPQYYLFLGLMLVTRHRSLHDLWGNLLNVQNYVGGIPHTWSLAVEEHAYLLLVGILAFSARARLRARSIAIFLAVSAALVVLVRLMLITHGHSVVTQTHTRIEGILYGVLLAMLYHYRPDSFKKLQHLTWLWVGLCGTALCYFRFQTTTPWSVSLGWDAADLLGVSMLMLLYRPRAKRRPALYRLVAWIGVYSYGIYLWHVSVIAPSVALSTHLPQRLIPAWLGLAPILGGIGLGAIFTKVVELPALKLRDRLYPRKSGSPVSKAPGTVARHRVSELDATPQAAGA